MTDEVIQLLEQFGLHIRNFAFDKAREIVVSEIYYFSVETIMYRSF